MCLALPTCILEVRPQQQALVELGGVKKEISTALVGEVKPGDYVIVHVGHAIGLLDPEEAKKTLAMFATLENGAAA
ncbi:HypC/HybG/HupF family hydrogenase formation chaperone [Curvibacter delicatus]|jgi:hydrogenase expression/formation protein HypC|uniref:HypC/HybG/HupF family hydrogenase formation chaperone n=1 Tax=Curvibacter delicatus TaxID=80879 RepID=UPI0008373F85|nr:HypC/HybG/HupF family hydrogenase formation chaperone [Curvibacter delicatus]